ncbi:MAG: SURF1 family protein [Legionellaceae bacterium]|nr:SURF1 family protein [Legionellaceae bacterium]
MSLLSLGLAILCAKLGFWQLARAHEKKSLLAQYAQQHDTTPSQWTMAKPLPKPFQRILCSGHYIAPTLLLDNQYYQHQFGVDVISLFQIDASHVVLVDRGFIPVSDRRHFPVVTEPNSSPNITGYAYYPKPNPFASGPAIAQNSLLIEHLDPAALRNILHKSLLPFIIRLDPNAPDGYIRNWPIATFPPERHQAYALQWFLLAIVSFGGGFIFIRKSVA